MARRVSGEKKITELLIPFLVGKQARKQLTSEAFRKFRV